MPTNSYDKALKHFNSAEIKKIEETLRRWAVSQKGQVITQNLSRLERFLPTRCMVQILSLLRDNHVSSVEKILKTYNDECYKHVLRGGDVDVSVSPILVGKVIERAIFYKWLRKEYRKIFRSQKEADRFIDKLLSSSPLSARYKTILLGSRFSIWVTWSEDYTKGPFDFVKYDMAEEARSSLGLEGNTGKRLVLLVYDRPKKLIKPTISDAGIFTFFQPAPLTENRHGWTKPWEPSLVSSTLRKVDKSFTPQPRPEAIHEANVVTISSLKGVKELV